MSYRTKDRKTGNLFAELLPFGGHLNENNRWMKLHDLVPWEELEEIYRKYFLHLGRSGKDSQLINGLLIVKHKMVLSGEEVVRQFLENPYIQYFCWYDQFVKEGEIELSILSKVRKSSAKRESRGYKIDKEKAEKSQQDRGKHRERKKQLWFG